MRITRPIMLAAALLASSVASRADACGGAFVASTAGGTTEPLTFRGQHWIFATGLTQSVLFVTFDYEGRPSEFAWVLPVRGTTRVELASPAIFEAVEAFTAPRVVTPVYECVTAKPNGCDCGGLGGGAKAGDGAGGDGLDFGEGSGFSRNDGTKLAVEIVARESVGPYESLQIAASDPVGLTGWLRANGYAVPAHAEPAIAAYVAEGFDFRVLRLRPGAATTALAPIRVVMAGGVNTIPLRLLTAGAGDRVPVTLTVLADGRLAPRDLAERRVDESMLVWDWGRSTSNWSQVRADSLAAGGVITSYAAGGALIARSDLAYETLPAIAVAPPYGDGIRTLVELYFERGSHLRGVSTTPPECHEAIARFQVSGAVPAEDEAKLACPGLDDLARATVGHDPTRAWLTRLELDLARASLGSDLQLEASPTQAPTLLSLTPGAQTKPQCRTVASDTPFVESASTSLGIVAALGALAARRGRRKSR